jgi:hypothetical protein
MYRRAYFSNCAVEAVSGPFPVRMSGDPDLVGDSDLMWRGR